jgi:hypothetical protein
VNALLRRFVELLEADLGGAGFVRRGPVFRYFDAEGNGVVLNIQRTVALWEESAFYINVGLLLAPYLRHCLGENDPRLDAMPDHGVWLHRLLATDDTASRPDHRFSLSTDVDVQRAATIVQTWTAANLPRMKNWLGDFEAMLAAIDEFREQIVRASAEQRASGEWKAGRWPEGHWSESVIRAYAHAERGDVDAITAETANWHNTGPDSLAAELLATAYQRRAERKG